MAQQDVEHTSSTTSDQAVTRQTQNKKRRLDYELQGHLSSLGFTSNKIPTADAVVKYVIRRGKDPVSESTVALGNEQNVADFYITKY